MDCKVAVATSESSPVNLLARLTTFQIIHKLKDVGSDA